MFYFHHCGFRMPSKSQNFWQLIEVLNQNNSEDYQTSLTSRTLAIKFIRILWNWNSEIGIDCQLKCLKSVLRDIRDILTITWVCLLGTMSENSNFCSKDIHHMSSIITRSWLQPILNTNHTLDRIFWKKTP